MTQEQFNKASDLSFRMEKLNDIIDIDNKNTAERLAIVAVKINMIDAKYTDGLFAVIGNYCIKEIDILNKEFEAL